MSCGVCGQPMTLVSLVQRPDELWGVCDTCDQPQCDCASCSERVSDCS